VDFVPYRQPVDRDEVWLVHVRGKFVHTYGGPAIAPSPNVAVDGTWFTVIDSLGSQFTVAFVSDERPAPTPVD